jgi:hypothetical protein
MQIIRRQTLHMHTYMTRLEQVGTFGFLNSCCMKEWFGIGGMYCSCGKMLMPMSFPSIEGVFLSLKVFSFH